MLTISHTANIHFKMKPITLKFSDTEAIDLLKVLKEKREKHQVLHDLAKERLGKEHKGNPEKLISKHKVWTQKTEALIQKIIKQI